MAENKTIWIIVIIVAILIVSNLTGFGLFSVLGSKPYQIISFSHSSCAAGIKFDNTVLSYTFDYGAGNSWDCEESRCDFGPGACNGIKVYFSLETTDTIQNGVTNGDLKLNYYSTKQPTYSINTPISCSPSGCTGTPFPLTDWDTPKTYTIDLSPYAGQTISSIYISSFETDSSCFGDIEPCQGAVIMKVDLNLDVYSNQVYYQCFNNNVYWYDSNNIIQSKKEECYKGVTYTSYLPVVSSQTCGQSFSQSRTRTAKGCSGVACYTNSNVESQIVIGTSCPVGESCESGTCVPGITCESTEILHEGICYDKYDTDFSGTIDRTELGVQIKDWVTDPIKYIIQNVKININNWKEYILSLGGN